MTAQPPSNRPGLHGPGAASKPPQRADVSAKPVRGRLLPLLAAILVAGGLFTWWMAARTDGELREGLLVQARLVAQTVGIDRVRALTGTEADLDAPDYLRLKEQLARAKAARDKCRFVYLMGRRTDGRVFFFVDNEPVGSEDESPAGQIYEEISPEFLRAFDALAELVEGPVTDRWGTWVSGLVPLTDPQTGELIAMLGMDVDARTWKWDVAAGVALPVGLMLTLLIVLGSGAAAARSAVDASAKPIQRRLLVPLAAVSLLLIGGFGVALLSIQRYHLLRLSQEKLDVAVYDLGDSLSEETKLLAALEEGLIRDAGLRDALKAQDRGRLLADYALMFTRFREEHGITHFYFHGPDRVNLLRVHKPEKNGDLIDRFTAREAERTGQTSSGIELGPLGTFALRVVQPVHDGQTLIGYLELGKEIEDILADIGHEHGLEPAVTIHKSALIRENWEAGMEMLGREADWDRLADEVIIYSSLGRFPAECESSIPGNEGYEHGDAAGDAESDGKSWRIMTSPLADASGAAVGELIVMLDVSEEKTTFNRLLAVASGGTLVLLTALFGFLYVLLRRVDRGILAREADLTRSERFQRTLTEASPDFIFVLDRDMTILTVNRLHPGLREEDVVGRSALSLVPPEHQDRLREAFGQALETRELRSVETSVRLPDGEHVFLNRLNPLPDNDEERNVLLVATEITERKQAERALQQAKEAADDNARRVEQALAREKGLSMELEAAMQQYEAARRDAEAANQAKSEFLANMSHEIRTPMTAVLGFTESLLDPDLSESEKLNAAHTVRRSGEHLLQIINDILDISKIEAGKLEVEHIRCSPVQIVADVTSLMQVRAEAKNLRFLFEYIGAVPETIESDPTRLRQILVNLIGNAIKFTETGGVRLITRFVDDGAEPRMQFDVLDTGLGMNAEQMGKLFRAFSQADTSTTRKFGGTGLGLLISKRLAETLGGAITVESKPGAGSMFRVTVPPGSLNGVKMLDDPTTATIAQPEEAAADKADVAGLDCRILLAEDGPDNQRLITHVLKKAGAEVTVVENGKLAAEAALAARDQGDPFDVILMDMQMPVMDGYEATSLLRRKGYRDPIIALTAHAMASDRQKCIDAGCDDYATKPIDRNKLLTTIQEWRAKRPIPEKERTSRPATHDTADGFVP